MKKIFILLLILTGLNIYGIYLFLRPTETTIDYVGKPDSIRNTLLYLGCPKQKETPILNGIRIAEDHTGINGMLIVCLIYTESSFRYDAKSRRGYKGLMQTKPATTIYPEVDILHGAMVLKDKLRITDGDLLKALTLYKGGRNNVAKKQAKEVLILYDKVKTKHDKENT